MPKPHQDGELADMPGWKRDPDGTGFIKLPPPPPPPPKPEPIPYGWKKDPDGTGLLRIPDEELPAPFRAGYWCKLSGLSQNGDMNGIIVELITTDPDKDGAVKVRCQEDTYWVKPMNLVPIEGSEKTAQYVPRPCLPPLPPFPRRARGSARSTLLLPRCCCRCRDRLAPPTMCARPLTACACACAAGSTRAPRRRRGGRAMSVLRS
jgi:hypothetical protein